MADIDMSEETQAKMIGYRAGGLADGHQQIGQAFEHRAGAAGAEQRVFQTGEAERGKLLLQIRQVALRCNTSAAWAKPP